MKFNLNCEIEIDPLQYCNILVDWYILNPSNPWWNDPRPYLHTKKPKFNIDLEWFNKPNIHNEIIKFWKDCIEGNYLVPKNVECPNEILDWFENWTFSNIGFLNKRAIEMKEKGIQLYNKILNSQKEAAEKEKQFYSFDNYIPPKNAKFVTYNGKEYKSKTQCCVLEGISLNTLNKYLNESLYS